MERKIGKESAHDRISPTAWGVAYRRTLSDIPFSAEIFDELQKIVRSSRSAEELKELEQVVRPEISPIFEARFKLVNRLLGERNVRQVLEIAAGFSPRGLAMAGNPSVTYVEFDLPGLLGEKRDIVETLIKRGKVPRHTNLHLFAGNALVLDDLLAATKPFGVAPLAVVNEGLLRYLTIEERVTVGRNVRELLRRFGGWWITPDLAVQRDASFGLSEERAAALNVRIERMTGTEITRNYFENEAVARAFFENLGFDVEPHSFVEIADELVSPQRLGFSKEQVETGLSRLTVFVMTLRRDGA